MQITKIQIEGYNGIKFNHPYVIQNTKRINFLIGRNSAGKSIPFRLLHNLKTYFLSKGHRETFPPFDISETKVQQSNWYANNTDESIRGCIELAVDDQNLVDSLELLSEKNQGSSYAYGNAKLVYNNSVTFEYTIKYLTSESVRVQISPRLYYESTSHQVMSPGPTNGKYHYLQNDKSYNGNVPPGFKELQAHTEQLLTTFFSDVIFFDTFRAINKTSSITNMEDGTKVLEILHRMRNDPNDTRREGHFKKKFTDKLNDLLKSSGIPQIIDFTPKESSAKYDLTFTFSNHDIVPISIFHLGSGITEIVVLLAHLVLDEINNKRRIYWLEEPESHLHPTLFKRFLNMISSMSNNQYFITTHSSSPLDMLKHDAAFYFCNNDETSGCTIMQVEDSIKKGAILDSLGISGSLLLQANCVIWVEGPTDRLYIRHWLNKYAHIIKKPELLEGSDYSFCIYGGKLLSRFSMDYDSPDDFIQMLKISRYSIVFMDQDIDPNDKSQKLRETKTKIIDECKIDTEHRCAQLTNGREIENDFENDLLLKSFKDAFLKETDDISSLVLTSSMKYYEEVAVHLKIDEINKKWSDKFRLSKKMIFNDTKDKNNYPNYISRLYDFISNANKFR